MALSRRARARIERAWQSYENGYCPEAEKAFEIQLTKTEVARLMETCGHCYRRIRITNHAKHMAICRGLKLDRMKAIKAAEDAKAAKVEKAWLKLLSLVTA